MIPSSIQGVTPLCFAAATNRVDVIRALLEVKADINENSKVNSVVCRQRFLYFSNLIVFKVVFALANSN